MQMPSTHFCWFLLSLAFFILGFSSVFEEKIKKEPTESFTGYSPGSNQPLLGFSSFLSGWK